MRPFLQGLLLTALCSTTLFAQTATQENKSNTADDAVGQIEETPQLEYVRIRRDERNIAAALETSIIRFGASKQYPGTTVDLVGAIHLGEEQYYNDLNEEFKKYDALLFEAVMPAAAVRRGLRPGGGGKSARRFDVDQEWSDAKVGLAAIGILQVGMKDALGLSFQLSSIDYMPRNFVHADMTQEEFESSMANRGESFSQILSREMGKAALEQQKLNPIAQNLDFALSLLANDRVFRVRRIAAAQLSKANEGTAFAEADGTSTIITERNAKAFDVLKQQLQRRRKKIGVFYGAGHFPDMEQRLKDEFGFERQSEKWLTAWELTPPGKTED